MPKNRNITAANATLVMVVEDLFPQGVKLEQFSTDAMVSEADETFAETRMGVDGQMVAGYVDNIKTLTVTMEPSSPSIPYMDTLARASRSGRKVYWVTFIISIPAIGKILTYSNGVLKTGKILPDIQKVLAPIAYGFDFESVK